MSKYAKREISLIDEEGTEWVRAQLTPPVIARLIKIYKAQNIWLEERAA